MSEKSVKTGKMGGTGRILKRYKTGLTRTIFCVASLERLLICFKAAAERSNALFDEPRHSPDGRSVPQQSPDGTYPRRDWPVRHN